MASKTNAETIITNTLSASRCEMGSVMFHSTTSKTKRTVGDDCLKENANSFRTSPSNMLQPSRSKCQT